MPRVQGLRHQEFFAKYYLHSCDVTFDLARNAVEVHQSSAEPWRVTLVDPGTETMTGGRLRRVLGYVGCEDFRFTYGDTVADVDVAKSAEHHRRARRLATITGVQPPGRFVRWGSRTAAW